MSCSPAEIERKRQEALKKLAKKQTSPIKKTPTKKNASGILSSSVSTKKALNFYKPNNINGSSPAKIPHLNDSSPYLYKPYDKTKSPTVQTSTNKSTGNLSNYSTITVTISLLNTSKILVNISPFSKAIIEILKTVPSRTYNPETRMWNFNIDQHDTILLKLNQFKVSNYQQYIVIESLPKFILQYFKDAENTTLENTDLSGKIDEKLLHTLLPFQLEGVQFGVQRNGRCLIADDMGLGKTFQALAIMNYYKTEWPLLIVTTASMRNVWEETIFQNIPSISMMKVQYMVSGKDFIGDSTILIVSHDLMSRCIEKLLSKEFGCIIIDESHNLKNYKAKVTQAALKLCQKATRVVLLSGTPALSRPKELYSQLNLLHEKFFGSFIDYAKRYCDMQKTRFGIDASGQSNLEELEIILRDKFMIRRKKEDVLGSIPNKTQEIIKLDINLNDINADEKHRLENLSSQYKATEKANERHSILLEFFTETSRIKIPAVCAYIETVLESKKKIIIFAHHRAMLDSIEKILKYHNSGYMRIDGNTSIDQRKQNIDKYQSNDKCLCALLSITSANSGITLTAAEQVIFAELHWNPSTLSQAEARAHRIGQTKSVLIQYLLADETADDYIWKILKNKENILKKMGLTKESFSTFQVNEEAPTISSKIRKSNFFGEFSSTSESTASSSTFSVPSEEDHDIPDDGFDAVLCEIDI